jgi:hypothetical protein
MTDETITQTYTIPQEGENPALNMVLGNLENLSLDELKAVHEQAATLIADKEKELQKQAMKEIHDLAAKHGLQVEVKGPRKRRGRSPKKGT